MSGWQILARCAQSGVRRGAIAAIGFISLISQAHAGAIFVMRVDGSDVRKVAQVAGYVGHGSPRFSHDDTRLAFDAGIEGNDSRRVFVINRDGTGLREIGPHAMPDWSPDDKQLAFHHYGGNVSAGVYVQNTDGQGRVFLTAGGSPRWSPDGGLMAFTDWRQLRLLDLVEGGDRVLVDEPFEEHAMGFDWSADGSRLAFVAKRNGKRELWIVETKKEHAKSRVRLAGDLGTHVAWSPDGKQLAITFEGQIHLLDVDGERAPALVPGQDSRGGDVAWSHDGNWLAFASSREAAGAPQNLRPKAAWKLEETGKRFAGAPAYSVALSSDGQRAILGGHTAKMGFQVWNPTTNEIVAHNFPAVFLALSPDGRTVAGTGLNIKIQLIDLEAGESKKDLHQDGIITSLRFSADGTRLLSTTLNKKAAVWDLAKGKTVTTFTRHEAFVFRGAFTPDGKEALTVGQDKTLRVWNAETGAERLSIPHPEPVWALAVSPDGRQAITGTGGPIPKDKLGMTMEKGEDNVLRLWEVSSGKLLNELKGHTHAAYTVDFSPDGLLAVSGGWDGTIRLWDLESGAEVAQAQGQGSVSDVKFSADGKQILVGGGANRFAGERVQYFNSERVRLFQVSRAGNAVEGESSEPDSLPVTNAASDSK